MGTLHYNVVILCCSNVAGTSFSQRCENNLLTTLYNVVLTLCVCWDIGERFRDGTRAHSAGAVYLPDLSGTRKEHMGERLPCTIRSVTEVRAVMEETLAVRAVGLAKLAPHTVTQVWVIFPTPGARGTVMIEMGPGPLGLCPVRGVVEVEKDSMAPYRAERCGSHGRVRCGRAGNKSGERPGRQGRVEQISEQPHNSPTRNASSWGQPWQHANTYLGQTDIIQHQIHKVDQPAIKQRVRPYPAAHREEERQLVEDMLAIGIIQESNSAWRSPTVLVKKKDGMTRFCIDYQRLNQVTKVDAYPLPHVEDSLNTLGGTRFFL